MKLLFVFILYLTCAHSAKILGVFPISSYSHFTPAQTLMNALVDQGHDVSVIAPYLDKASKFKTIHLKGFQEKMDEMKAGMNMFQQSSIFNNYFTGLIFFHIMGSQILDSTLEHPNVQAFLKSNEKYDAIIIEQFANEAFRGFCHHFNASCIIYSTVTTTYWLNPVMRNPENPSHMIQPYLLAEVPMNFCARVLNTLMLGFQSVVYYGSLIQQNIAMHRYFPNSPSLRDFLYETDLILLNSHLTFSEIGPLVPGMVEIGGFHVKKAGKLPEEFQKYMDQSKEGVILFSMGSVLIGSEMPVEKREMFVNVFKRLKMKVLWKYEEEIQGLPSNVRVAKWIPQKEIMAHPNLKLFITHGGMSSTIEAVNYGVPVVGIPVFGDQNTNMKIMKSKGLGVTVDFWNLNEEDLFNAIQTVLTNKQYAETAKKLSQLFNDRPMKPIDTATYWIEHVIRHKGGSHLRSRAVDLYWHEYMLIDVFAFLAVVCGVSIWLSCFLLKKIFCRKKTTKTADVTKNKKKQ